MNLLVKRFTLQYKGVEYKESTLMTDVPEKDAEEIIRVSDGDVIEVKSVSVKNNEEGAQTETEEAHTEMTAIDPRKTVGKKRK
nr:MAG TPA: hypothetical protein [Caudoviricetes sp.]